VGTWWGYERPTFGDDLQDDFVADTLIAVSDDDQVLESDADDHPQPPAASADSTATAAKRKRRLKEKERRAKVNMYCGAGRGVQHSV